MGLRLAWQRVVKATETSGHTPTPRNLIICRRSHLLTVSGKAAKSAKHRMVVPLHACRWHACRCAQRQAPGFVFGKRSAKAASEWRRRRRAILCLRTTAANESLCRGRFSFRERTGGSIWRGVKHNHEDRRLRESIARCRAASG